MFRHTLMMFIVGLIIGLGSTQSVFADHSFTVSNPRACLTEATFDGTANQPSALNWNMVGEIYLNGASILVASGNSHIFTSVGETHSFTVTYPLGTFSVGDIVLYSVTNIPGSHGGSEGDGGDWFVLVEDCSEPLPEEDHCPIFFDGRVNSCDTFNPVVLFANHDGNDQWRLDVYNAEENQLYFTVHPEEIAAVEDCPEEHMLIYEDVENRILFYRLSTCQFYLRAPMNELDKWYIIIFDELSSNTYYESFTEFIIGN